MPSIRVGYTRMSYGAEAVSYGASHEALSFRRVPFLPVHKAAFLGPTRQHSTAAFPIGTADLVHLYNDVCRSTRPWVATFEHRYPVEDAGDARGKRRGRAVALAGGKRCRAILAISEHARRMLQADALAGPSLIEKCEVLYPCVPRHDDLHERHIAWLAAHPPGRDGIALLFVGNQFFRKGGEFVLDAFETLAGRRGAAGRLTIVSTLETDEYVSRSGAERAALARKRISSLPGVVQLQGLSARAVREKMAESHLLLHPSLDETFGFVLAEALATGLDVVTTRIRAIPEIVPPAFLHQTIAVPTNDREEWRGVRLWRTEGDDAWRRAWEDARERVVESIRSRVGACFADPPMLAHRAPTLRERYFERFTPEGLGQRLFEVYSRALGA